MVFTIIVLKLPMFRVVRVRVSFLIGAQSLIVLLIPGYTLGSVSETKTGLTAQLTLTGNPCHVFSDDISNLTVKITYETTTRYV